MAKEMTIKEVKKSKADLELKLIDMFKEFEKETGLKVTYMDVQRKKSKKDMAEVSYEPNKGPIENVEVSVDLDLIY